LQSSVVGASNTNAEVGEKARSEIEAGACSRPKKLLDELEEYFAHQWQANFPNDNKQYLTNSMKLLTIFKKEYPFLHKFESNWRFLK